MFEITAVKLCKVFFVPLFFFYLGGICVCVLKLLF